MKLMYHQGQIVTKKRKSVVSQLINDKRRNLGKRI